MLRRAICMAVWVVPTWAWAAGFPNCAAPVNGVVPELSGVLQCQQTSRAAIVSEYETKHKRSAPISVLEDLDTHQRNEVRDFLKAHPEKATLKDEEPQVEDELETGSFMDQMKELFGVGQEKLSAFFGGTADKPAPKASAAETREAEAAIKALDSAAVNAKGMNLQAIMESAKNDPAKAVQSAVNGYNKDIQQNLDPGMKHFWDKPAN